LERIFDAPEISLAIAVDDEDLADGQANGSLGRCAGSRNGHKGAGRDRQESKKLLQIGPLRTIVPRFGGRRP
jgi:hypothetical protein